MIDESCLEASEHLGKLMVERDATFESRLKERGVTISAMDMDALRRAVADVPKKFEAKWTGFYEKIRGMK